MKKRTGRIPVGIAWMVVTGLNFVAVQAIVKHVGTGVPPIQAAFLRYLLGLIFVIPILVPIFQTRIDRKLMILFTWRGAVHAIAVILWFFSMTQITIAEVTAMNYLIPVYVTIGAALFLGERLAYLRILAIIVALIGTFIILRPGVRELSVGHMSMLATSIFMSISYLIGKRMVAVADASVIVGMLSLTVTFFMLPFAILVWVPPNTTQIMWLFLVALFATAGHYTMTLAFRNGPVSATQPATFLQLVWSVLIGAYFFNEDFDIWVITGGVVIIFSVCFIAWREAKLAKRHQ